MFLSSCDPNSVVYDLIGLGFGPANVAVAGALVERWDNHPSTTDCPIKKVLFLEKHDKFRWHPGMLLPDARMQISFLKDLATLRSPRSPITFLSYLSSQNRLVSFINRGSTIPTRKEYADYLSWAAQYVQDHGVEVGYGQEVVAVHDREDTTIDVHVRSVASGEVKVFRTKNIVISPGGSPRIPDVVTPIYPHPMIIHSSAYATSVEKLLDQLSDVSRTRPLSIAVIGSGQSAAEVTMDLRERLSAIPSAASAGHVDMIIRRGSLKPSDDSPFANEIFDPSATGAWFSLPSKHARDEQLSEYKSTNYGVVNPRTLENLYEIIYDQRLNEGIAARTRCDCSHTQARINIRPYSSIISLESPEATAAGSSCFKIVTQHNLTRAVSERHYDAIVCATGYQRSSWLSLLTTSNLGKRFGLDSSAPVCLTPDTGSRLAHHFDAFLRRTESDLASSADTPGSSESTGNSTPLTSPEPLTPPLVAPEPAQPLYISRNYRLMPILAPTPGSLEPKVYVQGVEEATHGLSDTLLSVLGVRAGEVVADLCA
ncbi:hypothetical protein HGRIS_012776 [Hohenbuehelia grisea]|uniref:L-ornithine N(5)-monooxygenase [NAD(P)H] n=1 Tax=Hohenbuehelia grisea TaxID=104357 RepID=A0ABR3ITI5_9AGAR